MPLAVKILCVMFFIGYAAPIVIIVLCNYIILLEVKYDKEEIVDRRYFTITVGDLFDMPYDKKLMFMPFINVLILVLTASFMFFNTLLFAYRWIKYGCSRLYKFTRRMWCVRSVRHWILVARQYASDLSERTKSRFITLAGKLKWMLDVQIG